MLIVSILQMNVSEFNLKWYTKVSILLRVMKVVYFYEHKYASDEGLRASSSSAFLKALSQELQTLQNQFEIPSIPRISSQRPHLKPSCALAERLIGNIWQCITSRAPRKIQMIRFLFGCPTQRNQRPSSCAAGSAPCSTSLRKHATAR